MYKLIHISWNATHKRRGDEVYFLTIKHIGQTRWLDLILQPNPKEMFLDLHFRLFYAHFHSLNILYHTMNLSYRIKIFTLKHVNIVLLGLKNKAINLSMSWIDYLFQRGYKAIQTTYLTLAQTSSESIIPLLYHSKGHSKSLGLSDFRDVFETKLRWMISEAEDLWGLSRQVPCR